MEIFSYSSLPSTQLFLAEAIRSGRLNAPAAVVAEEQTDGIGSRANRWEGGAGNLFMSFALAKSSLPDDLPLASVSVYCATVLLRILRACGSHVWLKWPNDLYIGEKKAGGIVTTMTGSVVVVGVGLNCKTAADDYAVLDIEIEKNYLLNLFLSAFDEPVSWKEVFSIFRVEFESNKNQSCHIDGVKTSLADAVLHDDGSVSINQTRIYSCR